MASVLFSSQMFVYSSYCCCPTNNYFIPRTKLYLILFLCWIYVGSSLYRVKTLTEALQHSCFCFVCLFLFCFLSKKNLLHYLWQEKYEWSQAVQYVWWQGQRCTLGSLLIILILNLLNKPFGLEHELTKRCQGEDVLFDIWLMMGDGL